MKMGCKFTGKCEFKKAQKSVRKGPRSRDSYRIYCSMNGGFCNQQTIDAIKCETPTVDTKEP